MDRFSVNSGAASVGGNSATATAAAVAAVNSGNSASGNIATASSHNNNNIVSSNNNSNSSGSGVNSNSSNNSINSNGSNNNSVKLRPDRNGNAISSLDSTTGLTSSTSSSLLVSSSYRKSFHRSGPGSASATSDYSMSTLAESIEDDHLNNNGSPSNNTGGTGGNTMHQHQHHSNGGGSSMQQTGLPSSGHNTSGLPGLPGQNNSNLTQAGLEEYSRSYYEQTMYHHQKQSSYAQSEGYHSYVSSSDSSSTPFLDRLRQDSELLLSRSTHNWSQQDLQLSSSNNSIADNNSSESTSSTETLKWLGSMSDVSEASHATSMSALSSAGSTSQLIAHSSRVRTPQRHNSESILFMSTDEQQQQQQHQQQQLQHQSVHSHQSPQGVTPIGSLMSQSMGSLHPHHHHHHPLGHPNAQTPSPNGSIHQASQQQHHQRGSSSSSSGGSPVEEDLRYQQRTLSNTSLASSASAPPSSSGSVRSSRSNNRLFPISTYTEIPSNVSSSSNNSSGSNNTNSSSNGHTGPAAATSGGANLVDSSKQLSPHNWQSVAERINELEKHQQQGLPLISNSGSNSNINSSANPSSASIGAKNLSQSANKQQQQQLQKYTYFDPSKTHRVSNPSLKAFQKNAVISYFERQQAYARESCHNLSRPTTLNLQQPQQQQQPQSQSASPPSMKSVSQRSSISSAYSSSGSTTDLTPSSHSPIGGSYHHHPSLHSPANIAAQQRLDKIAANNLRNQLASVHTMNFLNKVSPSQTAQLIESQMISNATLILSGSPGTTASDGQMQCSPATPEDPLDANMSPPPPPPRSRSIGAPSFNSTATTTMATAAMHASHLTAVRRTSSASEYSSVRDKMIQQRQQLSKDLLGPMIMGPIIALDDWVPERPPKNPMLRIPSPELPPPPPMMSPTEDVILINQDEPLPPPPPEILRHIRQLSGDSGEPKSNAASRRNSFAGQSCRKTLYRASTFENLSPPPAGTSPPQQPQTQSQISQLIIPPAVPKKPQPMTIEPQVIYRRPSSSLSKSNSHQHQTAISGSNAMHQAHRALMNGKLDQQQQRHSLPMIPLQTSPPHLQQPALPQFLPRQSDSRISLRKRSHNSQQMAEYLLKAASGLSSAHYLNGQIVPPPVVSSNSTAITPPPLPLKPRMTILGQQASPVVTAPLPPPPAAAAVLDGSLNGGQLISMGSKRSNSKASYLPRQPRDKLHSDPDHGSYKLTLTSNEDSINHNDVFSEDIITSPKCNLPDVLPPGVKYSLYSNNNNNNNNSNNTNGKPIGKPPKTIPHSAPIISANSLKSMFNFAPQQPQQNQVTPPSASSPVTPPPAYTATKQQQPISQPGSPTNQAISPKYTSQSTFDLKKTQILDSKYLTQSPPQIGLPSPIPSSQQQQQQPNGAINNANYLNHQQHSTNNICNQQTVNNCNEISEKSDFFEPSNNSPSTSTVEPVEAANHNNKNNTSTNVGSDHHSPAHDDGFSAKEEEDSISSCNTTICAEAEQPVQTTCSSSSKASAEEPKPPPVALERVTKEISLEPVEIATSSEIHPTPTKVVQRTEIVLRVAAPTTEASSQTDDDLVAAASESSPRSTGTTTTTAARTSSSPSLSVGIAELVIDHNPAASAASGASGGSIAISRHTVATSTSSSPPGTPTSGCAKATGSFFSKICAVAPRKVHPEEIDCDKLSHDLISQLSPSDKLHTILAPKTFKSSSDYVSDLFNIQIAPRPMKKDASTATPEASPQRSPLDILTTSSTYFQVSEPKAKLMTRYSREMTLINGDCCDLTKKKEELVQRLGKKLLVLSNEQTSIAEESNANDLLGNDVALKVAQKVRPTDASKFRSYVDDVGYITMLLLSLSGRLARTDNALYNIDDTHPDKKILEAKRERLLEQLDEAKQLKDDIDRRGAIISKLLEKSLTIEEYADYDYFINMKAKLIVDSREIADKIKLGEEQLAALKDTLVQSEC